MQIEVVVNQLNNSGAAFKTFEFTVDDAPETQECGSIAVTNEDGDCVAEFKNWEYWRKTGD